MKQPSQKLRLTALLLALVFGAFGVHRFYVRKIGTGMVQLLLTLSLIGFFVSSWWVIIDWVMIAAGTFEDKDGNPLIVWTRNTI
jgi:TM2 domain-containing membrane protein YozV